MERATEDVTEEISQIQEAKERQSHGLTMTEAIGNLSRPDVRTPFLLITINFYLVMLSGPFAIIFYSVQIFQSAGGGLDQHLALLAAIIVATIRVLGGIVGIFLVQKLPRVGLSMATMTLMSVSMAVLGGSLYTKTTGPLVDLLPLISVGTFMFSFAAGAAPLQFVFLGELLPREYKVLSGLVMFLCTTAIFLVTKIFPFLLASLSPPGTYWSFAAVSLASNLFYFFLMPETRGKTALEIKQMFQGRQQT